MFKAQCIPAYILHRHPYRETSLLLDLFTRDHGRISLVAKGARRNKKQRSVSFDPYQLFHVSWSSRTDLGTLTDIEQGRQQSILSDKQVFLGFYMNELIMHLLHRHEPHPELFDMYSTALLHLCEGKDAEVILRYFEKNLLQTLGYGLVFDVDVKTGEPVLADSEYIYEIEKGPVKYAGVNENRLKISGKTLLQLQVETLDGKKQLQEAKYLLRHILSNYLGNKKLQSRELYNAFIKAGSQA